MYYVPFFTEEVPGFFIITNDQECSCIEKSQHYKHWQMYTLRRLPSFPFKELQASLNSPVSAKDDVTGKEVSMQGKGLATTVWSPQRLSFFSGTNHQEWFILLPTNGNFILASVVRARHRVTFTFEDQVLFTVIVFSLYSVLSKAWMTILKIKHTRICLRKDLEALLKKRLVKKKILNLRSLSLQKLCILYFYVCYKAQIYTYLTC